MTWGYLIKIVKMFISKIVKKKNKKLMIRVRIVSLLSWIKRIAKRNSYTISFSIRLIQIFPIMTKTKRTIYNF